MNPPTPNHHAFPDSALRTPHSALPIVSTTNETFRDAPTIRHLPRLEDEDPRFVALIDSITRDGLHEPVRITARHEIVDLDSRDRYCAARAAGLPNIPCQIVPDDQVNLVFLKTLLLRRHLTQDQRVYLAYQTIELEYEEGTRRHHQYLAQNASKPQCSPVGLKLSPTGKSADHFAMMLGISPAAMKRVRALHKIFARDPGFRAEVEPKILKDCEGGEHEKNRPMSIHGALSCWGSRDATLGGKRIVQAELDLWGAAVKSFTIRAKYYPESGAARTAAFEDLVASFAELPPHVREDVAKAARQAGRQEAAA